MSGHANWDTPSVYVGLKVNLFYTYGERSFVGLVVVGRCIGN